MVSATLDLHDGQFSLLQLFFELFDPRLARNPKCSYTNEVRNFCSNLTKSIHAYEETVLGINDLIKMHDALCMSACLRCPHISGALFDPKNCAEDRTRLVFKF